MVNSTAILAIFVTMMVIHCTKKKWLELISCLTKGQELEVPPMQRPYDDSNQDTVAVSENFELEEVQSVSNVQTPNVIAIN